MVLSGWVLGGAGPSEAALAFLRDLKAGEREVDECLADSLLSVYCGEAKREAIRERLKYLGAGLRDGDVKFELLGEKRDGDSAGVLVAALSGLNPMDVEVVALGARKRGEAWKVAPVPGSFENAVDGFDTALEKRLAALEDWMGRERIRQTHVLQEAGEERLRKRMETAVPKALLRDGTAAEVVEGFLTACARRDLAAALVFVTSGLDQERSDEMRETVSAGLEGLDGDPEWGLLTRPGVAGTMVESDSEREVLAMFYDSKGPGAVRAMEFTVGRVNGMWQVILPAMLRDSPVSARHRRQWTASGEMQRQFPASFERRWKASRSASVEAAAERINGVLRHGRLEDLFRFGCRVKDMTEVEKMVVYAEMVRLWSAFRENAEVLEAKLVGAMQEGAAGLFVMHRVSASRITAPELVPVLMMRDEDGWGFAPGVVGRGDWGRLPKETEADLKAVYGRYLDEQEEWQKKAAAGFLTDFDEVGRADALAITVAEARHAVASFRKDLREGRMKATYRRCGLVNRSEGALEALNALRYESRGARGGADEDREMFTKAEGTWGAVSMRVVAGLGHEPDYPIYLVRKTEKGIRVMVDAGLRYATNPGRRILNDAVWTHLEEHLDPEDVKMVRKLFAAHNESSGKDYTEWEKNNK
jgi:hypothetical protein